MKFTDDNFTLMTPDEYYWDEGNILAFSGMLPDNDENGRKIIKQILDNQEKLEKIKALPFPVTHEENQAFIKQLMLIMNTKPQKENQS